jgi:myo-inositol-1(or 4)-monophosphatase
LALTRELEVAVEAAKAAGEVLRSGFGQQQSLRHKGEVDLVTEADEEAERKITQVLEATFPTYGLLTEESEEVAGEGDTRWIGDPLDGTTNYTHGLPPVRNRVV